MKVYIGPYKNFFGPYQLADLLQYVGVSEERCHRLGEWLSETWVLKALQWVNDKKKRKVQIRLDRYDTWNVDSTIALLVLPLLQQFRKKINGSGYVDDEDVPEHLRSTSAPPKENDWDTDEFFHARFEWVVDEMIWTFQQLQPDCDDESQFYDHSAVDDSKDFTAQLNAIKVDRVGLDAHNARINNGLRLFGKYLRNLWD